MKKLKINQTFTVLAVLYLLLSILIPSSVAIAEGTSNLKLSADKEHYQLGLDQQAIIQTSVEEGATMSFVLPDGVEWNKEQTKIEIDKLAQQDHQTIINEQAQKPDFSEMTKDSASLKTATSTTETSAEGKTSEETQASQEVLINYYQLEREITITNHTNAALAAEPIALSLTKAGSYTIQATQLTAEGTPSSDSVTIVVDEEAISESSESSATEPETSSQVSSSTDMTSETTEPSSTSSEKQPEPQKDTPEPRADVTPEAGWTTVANDYHATLALPDNYKAHYGFVTSYKDAYTSDVFQTDTYIVSAAGERVDYIYHNEGRTQQRMYVSETSFQLLPWPHDQISYKQITKAPISLVEIQPVAGGDPTNGPFIVRATGIVSEKSGLFNQEHDEFKVQVTITPNMTNGTLEYNAHFERLRGNGTSSAYNDKIGFVKVIDTDLAGNDAVDVKYIGNNTGMYIENDPYKIILNTKDVSVPANGASSWNAGEWYISGLLGSHISQPTDYFTGWNEATGAETNDGAPGETIKSAKDSAFALKWNYSDFKINTSRDTSYMIYLGTPHAPAITVDKPAYSTNIGKTIDVTGTWKDQDSKTASLAYRIDSQAITTFASDQPNPVLNGNNVWSHTFDAKALGEGVHTVKFYAIDNTGNYSETANTQITVINDEGYVFSKTYTKTGDPKKTSVGDLVHYKIYLENNSGHLWDGIGIQDNLPLKKDGLTPIKESVVATAPNGNKVTTSTTDGKDGIIIFSDGKVYYLGITVKDGENAMLEFDAVVNDNAVGKTTLTNSAAAAVVTTAGEAKQIQTSVDLPGSSIEKRPVIELNKTYTNPNQTAKGESHEGDVIDYSIKLGNNTRETTRAAGKAANDLGLYSLNLTDNLPAGLTYEENSIQLFDKNGKDITSEANQTNSNIQFQADETHVLASLGELAADDFITIKFKGRLAEGTAGSTVTNMVQVEAFDATGNRLSEKSSVSIDQIITNPKSPPVITTANKNGDWPQTDYPISGTWSDGDSATADLYYQVDVGKIKRFAIAATNPTPGQPNSYNYTIPISELIVGSHNITFFALDDTGLKSNLASVRVHIDGELSFKVTPPAQSTFATTRIPTKTALVKRSSDWDMTVEDTRGNGSNWQLTAMLNATMKDTTTGKELKGGLNFVKSDGTSLSMLPNQAILISTQDVENNQTEFPIHWEDDKGILLDVTSGNYKGNYSGEITWILSDAP